MMTSREQNGFDDLFHWAEGRDEYWVEGVKIEFAEDVVAQMTAAGVTRRELARRLGTSPAYVTKMLGGSTNFTLASMVRIARALGCELRTHLRPQRETDQRLAALPTPLGAARLPKASRTAGPKQRVT